jgi:multiple sugar transport system permease protein
VSQTTYDNLPLGYGQTDSILRLLNVPSIALVLSFSVLPLAYIGYLSFQDLRFGGEFGNFVGWGNYIFIAGDPSVAKAFWNTIHFSLLSVAIATFIGLGIALLLDSDFRYSGWLVAAVVLPWAIPEIVNALMWQWIYNPNYGALNGMLTTLGFVEEYTAWMSTPTSAMNAVIFAYSWKLVPFVVIILYAGLRSIPVDLYESAQIDGAGIVQSFKYVTLPLLAPSIAVAVLFCVVWSMRAFDIIYLLTKGGPGEATSVLSYFVFAKAFDSGDMGAAAATAVVLCLLTFVMTYFYIRVLPKGENDL